MDSAQLGNGVASVATGEESKVAINHDEGTSSVLKRPSDRNKPALCVQCADLTIVSPNNVSPNNVSPSSVTPSSARIEEFVRPKMVSISLHCVHSSPANGSIDSRRDQEKRNPCPKIQ